MIFLSVIPSKNIKFILKQSCSVIFNLWSLNHGPIIVLLVSINALVRPEPIQESSEPCLPRYLIPVALADKNPLELLWYLFASQGQIVWRIVRMAFVRHAHVLLTFLFRLVVMGDDVHSVVDDHSFFLLLMESR